MVERKQYLQELKQWKDDDVIKVVTGLRRCGKSTLLAQFQNWLLENGIENEQIISINFEELECETYCRRDEKAARKGRKAAVKAAAQIRKTIRNECRAERPQH